MCAPYAVALAAGALLLALSGSPLAATHTVRLDGAGDFQTIQPAIDGCAPGDTVLVGPGTYTGSANRNLDFHGVDLVLLSEAGREETILDCEELGRGLVLVSGETLAATIQGFTVYRARIEGFNGGGVYCRDSACTMISMRFEYCRASHGGGAEMASATARIADCEFIGNSGLGTGGALSIGYSTIVIDNTRIEGNHSGVGGGIRLSFSSLEMNDCELQANYCAGDGGALSVQNGSNAVIAESRFLENSGSDGGAIALARTPDVEIRGCTFEANTGTRYGGAIWYESNSIAGRSVPIIEDCLFLGNTAHGGGAIGLWLNASPRITRCTLVSNSDTGWGGGGISCINASHPVLEQVLIVGNPGGGIYTWEASQPVLSCCDVWGNPGGNFTGIMVDPTGTNGNLSVDPLFCLGLNPADPYTLQAASPCAPAGNDCGLQIGARGVGCDVVGVEQKSWGEVKSLY